MPIFEFYCTTTECPENTGHYPTSHRPIELLVWDNEIPVCSVCGSSLNKGVSAPRGYVKGTENPCKN